MAQFHYLFVLGFIAFCAIAVSLAFRLRVPRFWRNFVIADLSILVIYLNWDYWQLKKRIGALMMSRFSEFIYSVGFH